MEYTKIIVDQPRPMVQRITLNRPEKRNPLSNELRTQLFHALETGDQDDEVRVTIIRGAGPCFSAGYDLQSNVAEDQPFYTAGGMFLDNIGVLSVYIRKKTMNFQVIQIKRITIFIIL